MTLMKELRVRYPSLEKTTQNTEVVDKCKQEHQIFEKYNNVKRFSQVKGVSNMMLPVVQGEECKVIHFDVQIKKSRVLF